MICGYLLLLVTVALLGSDRPQAELGRRLLPGQPRLRGVPAGDDHLRHDDDLLRAGRQHRARRIGRGIGVYGQMASWSGLIHSACFFLIGMKLWYHGKQFGYSTQIQYFRDRFQSPAIWVSLLFPILVGWVVPYVVINILGSGAIIQTVTAGAFPRLFCRDRRRHPCPGWARRWSASRC